MGMKIITDNLALQAAIKINQNSSYGIEDSDFPLANLVNAKVHPPSLIDDGGSDRLAIEFDFGTVMEEITAFAVLNPNFGSDDGVYEIRYSETDNTVLGGDAVIAIPDSAMQISSLRGHVFGEMTDAAITTMLGDNPRYWYLSCYSMSAFTNYPLRVPEIWFFNNADATLDSEIVIPSANEQRGGSFNEMKTGGGNLHTKKNYEAREYPSLRWEYLTEAEMQPFYDLHAACWPNGTYILYYENDDPVFCYYRNKSLNIQSAGMGYKHVELTVEEVPEPIWEA